jgi:hypothetical protein
MDLPVKLAEHAPLFAAPQALVENVSAEKRAERTFLTPLPEVLDLSALAAKLRQDCLAELERPDRDGRSHRALWEEERACLLPLPEKRFAACQ